MPRLPDLDPAALSGASAAGLYTMVAMMLNAFEGPVPATMQKLV